MSPPLEDRDPIVIERPRARGFRLGFQAFAFIWIAGAFYAAVRGAAEGDALQALLGALHCLLGSMVAWRVLLPEVRGITLEADGLRVVRSHGPLDLSHRALRIRYEDIECVEISDPPIVRPQDLRPAWQLALYARASGRSFCLRLSPVGHRGLERLLTKLRAEVASKVRDLRSPRPRTIRGDVAVIVAALVGLPVALWGAFYGSRLQREEGTRASHSRALHPGTLALGEEIRGGLAAYKLRHGTCPSTDGPFGTAEENIFHHLSQGDYMPGLGRKELRALEEQGSFDADGYSRPVFLDGYGNPYAYAVIGSPRAPEQIEVASLGADGLPNTPDDILFPPSHPANSHDRGQGDSPERQGTRNTHPLPAAPRSPFHGCGPYFPLQEPAARTA